MNSELLSKIRCTSNRMKGTDALMKKSIRKAIDSRMNVLENRLTNHVKSLIDSLNQHYHNHLFNFCDIGGLKVIKVTHHRKNNNMLIVVIYADAVRYIQRRHKKLCGFPLFVELSNFLNGIRAYHAETFDTYLNLEHFDPE